MQIRSWPRWLRIVSTRIAVLPVVRSPMISSRWPRPIGIIESIAFRPVCTGSFTGCRSITPGALNSSGRRSAALIRAPPARGVPSGSAVRPTRPPLPLDHAGRLDRERPALGGLDRARAVERVAERIDDAADQLRADRDARD